MNQIPRGEYPRPSWVKKDWLNLNGLWQFAVDSGDSGREQGWVEKEFDRTILVPFCPESTLSGIGCIDFMTAVWYRRTVKLPERWRGKRLLLHFQAVDCDSTVWVDGREVCRHRGGFTPFSCDLGLQGGPELAIVLRARDQKFRKPHGKQSDCYESYGCRYTRTTGIWQTVWLEAVPEVYMKRPRITPCRAEHCFRVEAPLSANRKGFTVHARLLDGEKLIAESRVPADRDFTPELRLEIPADDYREWDVNDPFLYGIELELRDAGGRIAESGRAYGGMRSVTIDGDRFLLNGRPVFQRLVLDQGYYPDGILTAPNDAALVRDIELAQAAGFNGARLHEKVFEERFLYHADRLGYLVWGEFPDWGFERSVEFRYADPALCQSGATLITQWLEALERDYSHPALIGWCALNESGLDHTVPEGTISALDDITRGAFLAAKAADRTRPVLDASGYSHRVAESDIYDTHDYEQDPVRLAAHYRDLHDNSAYCHVAHRNEPYRGQPFFNSEFGGIRWNPAKPSGSQSWGYGDPPATLEEFYRRFDGLVTVLRSHPGMFGYCYTQLTDVFIEENGICFFDRTPKFDLARLRAIQEQPAACEANNFAAKGI